ncbi:MAG: hypothetical protein ACOYKD_05825 [Anaerolineaceae bacterium]|jgi:hypothetical protein
MKLNQPKKITFGISLVFFVFGILGTLAKVNFLAPYGSWLLIGAYVILALSVLLKDL